MCVCACAPCRLSPEEVKLRLEELVRKMKRKSEMMKNMTEQRIENVQKSLDSVSCALCTNQRVKRNQDYYIDVWHSAILSLSFCV